jgi:hypothetical protein
MQQMQLCDSSVVTPEQSAAEQLSAVNGTGAGGADAGLDQTAERLQTGRLLQTWPTCQAVYG